MYPDGFGALVATMLNGRRKGHAIATDETHRPGERVCGSGFVFLTEDRACCHRLIAPATQANAPTQSAVGLPDGDPVAMLARLAAAGREWRESGVRVGRDRVAGAVVADSGA